MCGINQMLRCHQSGIFIYVKLAYNYYYVIIFSILILKPIKSTILIHIKKLIINKNNKMEKSQIFFF